MKVTAVVLAGGKGSRFGSSVPKALMSLNGKPVVQYCLDALEPHVDEIVVVSPEPYKHYKHAQPGDTRGQSARNGVLAASSDHVLIHDGARPFLSQRVVTCVLRKLRQGAVVVDTAVPIVDGYMEMELPKDKSDRWLGMTPEAFPRELLLTAFELAEHEYDDEVGMVYDVMGIEPEIVLGDMLNTKITFSKDLENAEGIMRYWRPVLPAATGPVGAPTLVLGGSGGIGQALMPWLPNAVAPSRSALDLRTDFEVDLWQYEAVVHAAAEYESIPDMMQVNFDSVRWLVASALAQQWQGNIVVLGSTAATYGRRGIAMYSATKAALTSWVEASHEDLAEQGIRINVVAPAKVATRLQRTLNPDSDPRQMLEPDYVASRIAPYLTTEEHGHVAYLRYGLL